ASSIAGPVVYADQSNGSLGLCVALAPAVADGAAEVEAGACAGGCDAGAASLARGVEVREVLGGATRPPPRGAAPLLPLDEVGEPVLASGARPVRRASSSALSRSMI